MIICYSIKKPTIHNRNCQNTKQISYENYREEEIDEKDLKVNNLCHHCFKKDEIIGILELRLKNCNNLKEQEELIQKIEEVKKEYELKPRKQLLKRNGD